MENFLLLAENCSFENKKKLIRNVFITNIIVPKIQMEPLKHVRASNKYENCNEKSASNSSTQ